MQLARIVGYATATLKHESLKGQKMLIAQPLLADGHSPDGDPLVILDAVGAGPGETVMLSSDGRFVRELVRNDAAPARWSAIGSRDER